MQAENSTNPAPTAIVDNAPTIQNKVATDSHLEEPGQANPVTTKLAEPLPPQPTPKPTNTGAQRTVSANHQTSKERSQPYPVPSKNDSNSETNHPALLPSKMTKNREHNRTSRKTNPHNTPGPSHTNEDTQSQHDPNDLPMADPEPAEQRHVPNSGGYTQKEVYQPGEEFERYPNEPNWPSSGEESDPNPSKYAPVLLPPYSSSFRIHSPKTPPPRTRSDRQTEEHGDSPQARMSISPTPTQKRAPVAPVEPAKPEPNSKPSNSNRFPTLKPYVESTTSRTRTTTLSPFLDLPDALPTVHLDNQFMYMAVHERSLEKWRSTTGPGVLALLYGARPQKNGYNMTRAIQDTLALDLLGDDVNASACQPEPVNRNVRFIPAYPFLITDLTQEQEDLLLQIHLRATTSHAIFYYPIKLPISKHVLCIQHYNANPDEKGCQKVATMIKYSICQKKGNPEKFVATIKNMNPKYLTAEATNQRDLIDRCTMVVETIRVKGFMLGGKEDLDESVSFHNNRTGRPIFTMYIDSPTTDHDDHDKLLELLRTINYGDITSSADVVVAFNCSGCKGTDHVTVHCPFRKIPGWPNHSVEKSHPLPTNKAPQYPANQASQEAPPPQASTHHHPHPPASPRIATFEKAYSIYTQRGKGPKGKGRTNFNA
ncbi:hypothetical protein BJ165DRAFT_1411046 [Panaeolus papilionaceus]|nr:hypothetical protein BJ165DRAFT_1411046 [Panaeolus papilionaceus]